jgi:3-oxoacyl-[acyl-carrier protein] reductase
MKLKDKVALVTGSSRGVGKSIALAFAKEGAKVMINYTSNEKAANEVLETIRKMGGQAKVFKADVAKKAEAQAPVKATVDAFGGLDILVNNAGFTRPAMMLKMTEEQWDAVVNIHLKGAWLCAQAAAPHMIAKNSGKIINVTSVAGMVGTVGQINYSAAKGGVISMTKSMARELARNNICANVISLGIVPTDMSEKITTDEKLKEIYMNRILLKRFGETEELTPAFVFLASDDANYITGQLLAVDGGYGMI